jgi:5-methylcytosine-specific restriction endonuclease McrA
VKKPVSRRAYGSTLGRRGVGITRTAPARSTKPIRKENPEAAARRRKAFNARLHRKDWKELRQQCFDRDGYRCTIAGCGVTDHTRTGEGLVADHLTYARFGHELLSDLRTLCKDHNRAETVAKRANWAEPRR